MINNLRLQNFRSYKDETFEFSGGVNIIVGPNASGKTNLLETILIVCSGRTYKTGDTEMIRYGQTKTRLTADDNQKKRIITFAQENDKIKKQYNINGQTLTRLPLNRTIPVVLFQPENLQLISGSPERRREFVDDLLSQTTEGYKTLISGYQRALAQRNRLLKQGRVNGQKQLFAWNIRLSELAGQIVAYRQKIIEEFNEQADGLYKSIAHSTKKIVKVSYKTSCPSNNYTSQLLKHLEANEQQDFERGFTSYGPHREDVQIFLGGHLAQNSASRGEIRTLVLAIKILELKLLEDSRNQSPILLLDDVFSELDGSRRKTLTSFLKKYQTFITTTDADIVVHHFMDNCTIIPLGS